MLGSSLVEWGPKKVDFLALAINLSGLGIPFSLFSSWRSLQNSPRTESAGLFIVK